MDELLFLGTGAADWTLQESTLPLRRNSAMLLNRKILLDCGPHIWHFAGTFNPKVLDGVTDVLITHGHSDHFCLESFLRLADRQKIRLVCDAHIKKLVGAHPNVDFITLQPFHSIRLGSYKITPVPANHDVISKSNRQACHYIIRTPHRKYIFYGLDGAWFLRPSWEEMCKHKFDAMILDCTVGDQPDWRMFEHNTIPMLRMMTEEIKHQNMLRPKGLLIGSHFARTLHGTAQETAEILRDFSMLAAEDNMKIGIK